jgi:putative tryptophan/tyrosine transport system substrate-binding protein
MERHCRLSRRQFVVGAGVSSLGLLAGCGRWPWQAQAPAKVARVGYLHMGTRTAWQTLRQDTLRQGLRELGYIEGHNLALDWRLAEGDPDRLAALAAELVRAEVDVTVAFGDVGIRALKNATSTVPIVMVLSRDPVGAGFVASLARPGGNVTGLSAIRGQLASKRLELLKETIPGAARVAVLWNPGADLAAEFRETEAAAQTLGLQLQSLEVRGEDDFERAFAEAIGERADALVLLADFLTTGNAERIVPLAARSRLPTMYEYREWVSTGGLMAYGPSQVDQVRRAAYYVDRILKGAKPADLPVEQPMTFDFVVNMKTARELGITFPNEIMLQVTEVIE